MKESQIILIFFLISSNGISQEKYLNSEGVFSFNLPNRWAQIPQEVVDEFCQNLWKEDLF